MATVEPSSRFSHRVQSYIQSRPGYPSQVYTTLLERGVIHPGDVVADVGSGTGLSARLFLDQGHTVFGVEPNTPMREAGARLLAAYPHFVSVEGQAEATTLGTGSVNLVVAGQAFHWFEPHATAREWRRLLRPRGFVVLMWNDRKLTQSPFLVAYEELLQRLAVDYTQVNHQNLGEADLVNFMGPFETWSLPNSQHFDREGLRARAASSSYVPPPGHPDHLAFFRSLDDIFAQHSTNGEVVFEYDTRIYSFPSPP